MDLDEIRGSRTVRVEGSPETLYGMVSDVTRMGEWSPETYSAEWVDGATGPAVGARFKGKNRRGKLKWSTTCTVLAADAGKEFTFVVGTPEKGSTRWSYTFAPSGSGAEVTESWQALKYGWFAKMFAKPEKTIARLDEGMATTLANFKSHAEHPAA
jgi:hypothetical protein